MVNILAILLCAVASIILGSLWYGPIFGKQWMSLMKFKKPKVITPKIKREMSISYSLTFIASIITATILALLATDYVSLSSKLSLAFLIWLGFLATTMLGSIFWEGKPVKLYALNVFYHLVNFLIMALIIHYV